MLTAWIRRVLVLTIATLLVMAGFFVGTMAVSLNASPSGQANLEVVNAQETAQPVGLFTLDEEQIYSSIYNEISPSVVSINVVARASGMGDFVPEGFAEGTGTGFVIDDLGHIVTNNHVVEGANRIEVNFFDGTIARGEIVGTDPDSDIAVVKVNLPPEQLQPVTFGDSDNLFIGQNVVALGSPFGQRWTMTTGIISALERTIQGLGGYQIGAVIQTDAAINPGNSGGPLLDLQGQVVGVNSQIISRTRSSSGIGFAVPANLVQRVAQELIEDGAVDYSYLGISSRPNDVDLALIEAAGLPNDTQGVVVMEAEPGGPAQQAGVRDASGFVSVDGFQVPTRVDIITAIDGQPVTGFNTLIAYLSSNTRPGQTINLTILRDGQEITLPVVLGERPNLIAR